MTLDVVVRRVTEAEDDGQTLTAVRFRYEGQPPSRSDVKQSDGGLLFVNELSYVYPGPARHKVGDRMRIAVQEVVNAS